MKQKYGHLPGPKYVEPHWCRPPGFFQRLYSWLIFKPIRFKHLWRCNCGCVYQWYGPTDEYGFGGWGSVTRQVWIDAGGDL